MTATETVQIFGNIVITKIYFRTLSRFLIFISFLSKLSQRQPLTNLGPINGTRSSVCDNEHLCYSLLFSSFQCLENLIVGGKGFTLL